MGHRSILISNWIVLWSMIHLLFYPTVFNNHWHFYFCQSKVIRIPETTDETFDALFQFSKELGKVPVSCKVSNVHKKIVCAPLSPRPCLNPFLLVILSKMTPWILLIYPWNVLKLKQLIKKVTHFYEPWVGSYLYGYSSIVGPEVPGSKFAVVFINF